LKKIFVDLKVRELNDVSDEYTKRWSKLRANIDVLDASLLETLGKK
jgi:chorismate mutase